MARGDDFTKPWEREIFEQSDKAPETTTMPLIEKVATAMFGAIALAALAITYMSIAMGIALHNCSF